MPNLLSDPFIFSLPKGKLLKENTLRTVSFTSPLFQDILKESTSLVQAPVAELINKSLNHIWSDKSHEKQSFSERAQPYSNDFLDLTNNANFLRAIICARDLAIIKVKENPPLSELDQINYIKSTEARLVFMTIIAYAMGNTLFDSKIKNTTKLFLRGIFQDLHNISELISLGLYKHYFTQEHSLLITYFEQQGRILNQLKQYIFKQNKDLLEDYLNYFLPTFLHTVIYYFAIGQDQNAEKYLDPKCAMYQSIVNAKTNDPKCNQIIKQILEDIEELKITTQKDNTRKTWAKISSHVQNWFTTHVRVLNQSSLKKQVKGFKRIHQDLKKITNLTDPAAEETLGQLLVLHTAYLDNYSNNLEFLEVSENIILELQKIMFLKRKEEQSVNRNAGNPLAIKLNFYLNIYLTKINEIRDELKTASLEKKSEPKLSKVSNKKPHPSLEKKEPPPSKLLSDSLKAIEAAIEQCDAEINNLTQENTSLASEANEPFDQESHSLAQTDKECTEKLAGLEELHVLKTQTIGHNKAQIQLLQTQMKDLEKQNKDQQKKGKKKDRQIATLEQENKDLQTKKCESQIQLDQTIADLNKAIAVESGTMAIIQQQILKLDLTLKEDKAKKAQLEKEIQTIQENHTLECQPLDQESAALKEQILGFQSQNQFFYSQIKALTEELNNIERQKQNINYVNTTVYETRLREVKKLYLGPLQRLLSLQYSQTAPMQPAPPVQATPPVQPAPILPRIGFKPISSQRPRPAKASRGRGGRVIILKKP